MKLENRYKEINTGKLFKVINFTTNLDSVTETVIIKQLDNDNVIEIDECKFRNKFIKIK